MPRVLIVEDDAGCRYLLRDKFRKSPIDWAIREASSSAEGLQVMSADPPDFVVLDWCMPGLSGAAAVEAFRAAGPPETKILVYTALADPRIDALARAAGADEVLRKGTGNGELESVIRHARTCRSRKNTLETGTRSTDEWAEWMLGCVRELD